ncbi:MAG: hypoxanthine-guanine phosphoribosyltransferase [Gammaproteobacteria bacterium HGW-Gammaproteobacteria-14]|nr:MAG: hypoxanthine-guanine phosphoribosyltransferase [Gammaproteobacteria bacterium HGW-Gammaproteobacteria-14]
MTPEFRQHLMEVRANARQLYSSEEIDAAIAGMAEQINQDYAERDPLLLTIMNGGVVLMGKLLPLLDFPLQIDYLHASRYRGETAGTEIEWIITPGTSLKNREVIIVDDILDVGSTLLAIIAACEKQGAASVATAVLVDKVHNRKAQPGMKADYTGVEAEDAYLFGCGMDYREYWRNAPGLFAAQGV